MDSRSLVFGVGDEICGWGRLVRTREGDWFDPPLPIPAVGYGAEGPPPPQPTSYAIPVDAADFGAVERRYERDGAVEGYAKIYGRWFGARISVDWQANEPSARTFPRWSDPPCDPPSGGWPHGMNGTLNDNLEFDLGDLEDTGAAVTTVIFRPSDDQAVLVVAATDIPAVEALLRPQLSDRLCIVPSRWTKAQLDAVQEQLRMMWARWGIYGFGTLCDEQAQASISVSLLRVTDEIADWAQAQPARLITLEPWLRSVNRNGR